MVSRKFPWANPMNNGKPYIYIYIQSDATDVTSNAVIHFMSSTPTFGFVWKCLVYSQWNSHLIGIMISKTIGFRGTLFSDTPICSVFFSLSRYLSNISVGPEVLVIGHPLNPLVRGFTSLPCSIPPCWVLGPNMFQTYFRNPNAFRHRQKLQGNASWMISWRYPLVI